MALKAMGLDELKAAPGKFRAIIIVDSEPYQIDDDAPDVTAALNLCISAQKSDGDIFQVFDDQGAGYI